MIERDIKYTYQDWWEGKIYFGGSVSGPPEEVEQFRKNVPLANSSDFSEEDEKKIKLKRREIFENRVNERVEDVKASFMNDFSESSEKEIFIDGIIKDFEMIFYSKTFIPPMHLLKLDFMFKYFPGEELEPVRQYYFKQNVLGKRDFSFIQSPNQASKLFESNPIEIYSEMLYRTMKWLKKEKPNLLNPKNDIKVELQEEKAIKGFNQSDKIKLDFNGKDDEFDAKLSILRATLKSTDPKFIAASTTAPQFKRIFLDKEINDKIIWEGTVKELTVFINEIISNEIIVDPKKKIWTTTIACFSKTNKNGKPLTIDMLSHPGLTINDTREQILKQAVANFLKSNSTI